MKRGGLKRLLPAAAIAAVMTLLGAGGLAADVFAGFRRQAADALFPSEKRDPRVVVVGVDARSILEVATPWPWPRSLQAELVRRISAAGARMVLLDVLYSPAGPGDAELAAALAGAPGAVVAAAGELTDDGSLPVLRAGVLTRPVAGVAAAATVGHVNVTPDSADAVVRALPLVVEGPDGEIVPSLTLAAVEELNGLGDQVILRRNGLQVGGRFIPTDGRGRLEVNFTSGLPSFSASDVLAGRVGGGGELAGKIVLLGVTDPALGDSHVTPVDKGGRMPGVFIHANALNTLLTRSYLTPARTGRTLAWVFGVALAVAAAVLLLPLWAAVPVAVVEVAVNLVVGISRFADGLVVDLLYPTLAGAGAFVAALAFRYASEVREQRRMRAVLSQYVPPSVAHQLLGGDSGGALPTGTITFLFTDVVGSTATWEKAPREMSQAMRLHDSLIDTAVRTTGGALVRPRGEGDSRFAVFVNPESAVRAAAEICRELGEERWPTPEPIRVRMALHTGEAQLWEGDYYGSPPNRCARIRAVAEPGQILLSSTTVAGLGDVLPEGTSLRGLGPVKLKDFEDPEDVSELVVTGRAGDRWQPALVEPGPDGS